MINLIILSSLYSDVGTIASPVSTVEEVLGKQRKKIQPWVTNEVLDLCDPILMSSKQVLRRLVVLLVE